jgi:hypothetical protein
MTQSPCSRSQHSQRAGRSRRNESASDGEGVARAEFELESNPPAHPGVWACGREASCRTARLPVKAKSPTSADVAQCTTSSQRIDLLTLRLRTDYAFRIRNPYMQALAGDPHRCLGRSWRSELR